MTPLSVARLSCPDVHYDSLARPHPLNAMTDATLCRATPAWNLAQDCVLQGLHTCRKLRRWSSQTSASAPFPAGPFTLSVSFAHLPPASGCLAAAAAFPASQDHLPCLPSRPPALSP